MQPGVDEGIGGEHANESVEADRDGTRPETSVQGASVTETPGDDTEVEAIVSAEALATDAAVAPEVWTLESVFVLGWVIFVEFKQCTKPAQVPHGSGPAGGMDIIYVDTPSSEAAEKSSSYNMSIFLLGLVPKVPRMLWLPAKILAWASGSDGPT
jgi:hypothetical protein